LFFVKRKVQEGTRGAKICATIEKDHYLIGEVLLVFLISNKTLTLVIALGNLH